ncbi:MAG: bifunctional folylpolyglutamate synthase/dihydrofolate synthase, partial [Alphaproteobacteria bacterium]
LGGRLDTTNMVRRPALTAITPVSRDHERFLGTTLAEIAGEKAGILKPGVPCVLARQSAEADAAIAVRAAEIGAPLYRRDADWSVRPTARGFCYSGRQRTLDLPPPALFGAHQIDNAGLALACVEKLACSETLDAMPVGGAAIRAGIGRATWPARLQRLTGGALAARLGAGWELWLDGGHNPAAAEMLAGTAAGPWADRPLDLVFGHMAGRDAEGFLARLAPHIRRARTVAIPGEANGLPVEDAAQAARRAGIEAQASSGIGTALGELAAAGNGVPGRVLICGSLYLAGAALRCGT